MTSRWYSASCRLVKTEDINETSKDGKPLVRLTRLVNLSGSRLTDSSLYSFLFSSLVAVFAQYVHHEFASSTYCASRSHLHVASRVSRSRPRSLSWCTQVGRADSDNRHFPRDEQHAGCGGPGGIGEVFVNGIPGFSSFLQEQPSLVDLCTISSKAIQLHR